MKLGFIGLGNMASAIIGGILKKELVSAQDIIGSDKSAAGCEKAASQFGITACTDNKKVAAEADVLFFAVKPIFLPEVMEEIKDVLREDTLIISIVAGKSIAFMEEGLGGKNRKIIRCMPNTPALVNEGCTGACANANVTVEEMERGLALLRSFGVAQEVPERLMDAVVGVSGSAPAYVFMFIEAMADAAVAAGMPRNQAYTFAAQTVMGSAKMVLETGKHPGELKDMVCSPGGTTIDAVKVLERKGLRAAVMDAMDACIEKSKNL
ncbi:MAG: pyrroline-5-carboxylate reductase [Lachnospiraceae bacterium]|nr:pyrroline-5-carboxylate reductase [Lachnospiraceae bacterium]